MNLRDQIAAAKDTQLVKVPVPEWNCDVYVRELCVGDRLKLWDAMGEERFKDKPHHIVTVIFCVCDDSGKPIFTLDDFDLILSKSQSVIVRLSNAAVEVNRLLGVDEAKKN